MKDEIPQWVDRPDLVPERQREADSKSVLIRGRLYWGPIESGDGYIDAKCNVTVELRGVIGGVSQRQHSDGRPLEEFMLPAPTEMQISEYEPLTDDEDWTIPLIYDRPIRIFVDGECLRTKKRAELAVPDARPTDPGGPFVLVVPLGECGPFSVRFPPVTDS